MRYINREVYESHLAKSSERLLGKKQLTLIETQEMEKNIQLARFYRSLEKQWEQLLPEQRQRHLTRALKDRAKIMRQKPSFNSQMNREQSNYVRHIWKKSILFMSEASFTNHPSFWIFRLAKCALSNLTITVR